MLSKKEAQAKVVEWIDEVEHKQGLWHYGKCELRRDIDRIYDSIGSCKECVNWTSENPRSIDCYKMWSISCSRTPFKDWYCADFERKET